MRVLRRIVGGLLLTVALSSFAHAGGKSRSNPDVSDTGRPQTLPLAIYRNFVIVAEGQFGPLLQHQNFVLDTGTVPSIVNARVASRLELAKLPATLRAAGKAIPAQAAILPELELGPICAASLPVQVQDLSRLESDLGIPIAGIIGLDVLSKSSFNLNYERKEIEFGNISAKGIPVRIDPHAGLAVAELYINGKPARMLVDTGSDRLVVFGGNFPENAWPVLPDTSQLGKNLLDQQMRVRVFSGVDIVVETRHFSADRAYVLPASSDSAFDGLLGVRALGFRVLSYDQSSGMIYLQK